MNRLISRFWWTCTLLCAAGFANAQPGRAAADSLFSRGQYLAARVLYEELLFLRAGDASELLLLKSYCYKAEEKYEEGLRTLQRADFFSGTDSLRYRLYYEAALHAFLAGRTDLATGYLAELNHYLPQSRKAADVALEVISLHAQKKMKEAETVFETWAKVSGYNGDSPYKNWRGFKSPERAENRSYLLPGMGQIYAGYPGRGLTSLFFQSGFVGFSLFNFFNGFYFSGAFTGVAMVYMFYTGGARYAGHLAEQTNKRRVAELDERVLQIIKP